MALNLPQDGDLDWDVKLNAALEELDLRLAALEAAADDNALAVATQALNTATTANNVATDTAGLVAGMSATLNEKVDKVGQVRVWAPGQALPPPETGRQGDLFFLDENGTP